MQHARRKLLACGNRWSLTDGMLEQLFSVISQENQSAAAPTRLGAIAALIDCSDRSARLADALHCIAMQCRRLCYWVAGRPSHIAANNQFCIAPTGHENSEMAPFANAVSQLVNDHSGGTTYYPCFKSRASRSHLRNPQVGNTACPLPSAAL